MINKTLIAMAAACGIFMISDFARADTVEEILESHSPGNVADLTGLVENFNNDFEPFPEATAQMSGQCGPTPTVLLWHQRAGFVPLAAVPTGPESSFLAMYGPGSLQLGILHVTDAETCVIEVWQGQASTDDVTPPDQLDL